MQRVTVSKRLIIWCTAILGVLLVAVVVSVSVLVGTLSKQADDEAYSACVQRLTANATTVDQVADAAEFCSR